MSWHTRSLAISFIEFLFCRNVCVCFAKSTLLNIRMYYRLCSQTFIELFVYKSRVLTNIRAELSTIMLKYLNDLFLHFVHSFPPRNNVFSLGTVAKLKIVSKLLVFTVFKQFLNNFIETNVYLLRCTVLFEQGDLFSC